MEVWRRPTVAAVSFLRAGEREPRPWVRVVGPVAAVAGAAVALFLLRDLRTKSGEAVASVRVV
jgi:hypothetical protein